MVGFSVFELDKIIDFFNESILSINSATRQKVIIIELWLMVDYYLRHVLLYLLGLLKFETEDFNAHYALLPKSFEDCLKMLEKKLKYQRTLKERIPPGRVEFPGWLTKYILKDENRKMFDEIIQFEKDMMKIEFPELSKDEFSGINLYKVFVDKKYQVVEGSIIKSLSHIDDNWFEEARKINKARNIAAHNINQEKVFEVFGITGEDKINLLKHKVEIILNVIFGKME